MIRAKERSFVVKREASSLFKKRLCVAFVFMCMLVNGFALSTVEIGRHSLFMITIAATQNIVSQVIGKCNESLAEVSKNMYDYIGSLVFGVEGGGGMQPVGQGEEGKKGGAGKTAGVAILPLLKESKRVLSEEGAKALNGKEELGIRDWGYGSNKASPGGAEGLVILFLVFISAIRQRKGIGASIINKNREWKTRISA